ncbi:MAG: hypothetical protein QOF41_429 [Methylobacteriaceae bacterium]|nr:hypothetical protein [Methylobacteriaceae bacterium]
MAVPVGGWNFGFRTRRSRPIGRLAAVVLLELFLTSGARKLAPAQATEVAAAPLPDLDQTTAEAVLPYARMACDAYATCAPGDVSNAGYKREKLGWQEALRRTGAGERIVTLYQQAGFSATLFRNDGTKEIVLSLRGTDEPISLIPSDLHRKLGDWETNADARTLKTTNERLVAQYVAARSLASRIQKLYSDSPYRGYRVTLVGHSLGGGMASYAGQHVDATVYAFDPARNVLAGTGSNPRQTNIITTGDPVSDANASTLGLNTGKILGTTAPLPGRTFRVDLPSTINPIDQHHSDALVNRVASVSQGVIALPKAPAPTTEWLPSVVHPTRSRPFGESVGKPKFREQVTSAPEASVGSRDPVRAPQGPPTNAVSPRNQGTQMAYVPHQNVGPASATSFSYPAPSVRPSSPVFQPGGISISRAAAEHFLLNISIDSASLSGNKIVLSGRNSKAQMDAALFLTALRAACDENDPYFSLEPDDGALWSKQSGEASKAFFGKIKGDLETPAASGRLLVRAVSAARDYPTMWRQMTPRYPNLRSKLVFRPQWLAQTRFGEVLYKADVLLKELTSGISILRPGRLRAADVNGYLASNVENSVAALLAGLQQPNSSPGWQGARLWFDLAPTEDGIAGSTEGRAPSRSSDAHLQQVASSQGFIRRPASQLRLPTVIQDGDAVDLSQVNPRMFVRARDTAKSKDLADNDPRLDGLAYDVSARFEEYAQAYDELSLLRDLFRAYVAAVQLTTRNDHLCTRLEALPLLDSETLVNPLPDYRPSELFVTIAKYTNADRRFLPSTILSVSGGVSIGGGRFLDGSVVRGETPLTRMILHPDQSSDPDRRYISLVFDGVLADPFQSASTAPATGIESIRYRPIENEPPATTLPAGRLTEGNAPSYLWLVLSGVFLGILVLGLKGRPR